MATQASPGLNAPCAYDPLPGIPPNMSIQAAMSAGLVPHNVQITNTLAGKGRPNALLERMSESGTVGSDSTIGGASAFHPMCNSANGGSGPGAGGCNQDLGQAAGRDDAQCGSMPASAISVATPTQFVG